MNRTNETIAIEGMSCGHCVSSVKQALEGLEGVEVQHVEIGTARINYDATAVDHATIRQAIEEEGYTVREAA